MYRGGGREPLIYKGRVKGKVHEKEVEEIEVVDKQADKEKSKRR